ncbi:hypothetical protein [Streptomyces sp. NPDC057748]|uniref:hypothetical protein n=1 Tax=unclassified Streptomyces TaxID=2593676 RepID=UPI0036A185DB
MLTELKARRIARYLVDEFPEITQGTACARARRLLSRYPSLSVEYAGEYLVRGERAARVLEQWMEESA